MVPKMVLDKIKSKEDFLIMFINYINLNRYDRLFFTSIQVKNFVHFQ